MKVLDSYGDNHPEQINSSTNYSVRSGLTIPEKYLRKNILKEKILDEALLKSDLDIIIQKTPIQILPFDWGAQRHNVAIIEAEVSQFVRTDTSEAIPRDILLKINKSLEMIEPDLTYHGIAFFRAFSDRAVIGFELREKIRDFTEKDFVNVAIKRFYP